MFQRATRQRVWMKLALTGPSGSGKTYSAIRLASGLGTRLALLDTENRSAHLYSHLAPYDVAEIEAPFTVEKYRQAIREAAGAGYDVLVIDSLSHAWAGTGGLLDQKAALDKRGGNQYTNWGPITAQHEQLKAAILESPLHIIATMRSKQDYIVNEKTGKPEKLGMAPIQRDGMEYEFTVVLDIAGDHTALPSKDRTGLFAGHTSPLTEDHGARIGAWLDTGAEPPPPPAAPGRPEPALPPGPNPEPPNDGRCPECRAPAGKPHASTCSRKGAER